MRFAMISSNLRFLKARLAKEEYEPNCWIAILIQQMLATKFLGR